MEARSSCTFSLMSSKCTSQSRGPGAAGVEFGAGPGHHIHGANGTDHHKGNLPFSMCLEAHHPHPSLCALMCCGCPHSAVILATSLGHWHAGLLLFPLGPFPVAGCGFDMHTTHRCMLSANVCPPTSAHPLQEHVFCMCMPFTDAHSLQICALHRYTPSPGVHPPQVNALYRHMPSSRACPLQKHTLHSTGPPWVHVLHVRTPSAGADTGGWGDQLHAPLRACSLLLLSAPALSQGDQRP